MVVTRNVAVELEEWELAFLRALQWNDNSIEALLAGNEAIIDDAHDVLHKTLNTERDWFKIGWEAGQLAFARGEGLE